MKGSKGGLNREGGLLEREVLMLKIKDIKKSVLLFFTFLVRG